jgi:hypothetical protein
MDRVRIEPMALAQLGKQLAQQMVGDKIQDVMDSLRPPDVAKILDPTRQERPAPPVAGEPLGSAILGQIQAMQRACKEDQELVVLCNAGLETLRVLEFYAPSAQLLVMTGIDTDRNVTRVISPIEAVQLVCKVMSAQAGAKPARINFINPKPK